MKAEGGAKRRGIANVNGVTKLEQLAFCLECEDSGPWQMTAAVPANALSLDDTCDRFCFSRAYFKGNGKHVSCRKLTAVLGKCFLSSFRKCCSPDTSKTGFYLNWVTELLLFFFYLTQWQISYLASLNKQSLKSS